MSQALRKLAGTLNRTDTICLFTNQLRKGSASCSAIRRRTSRATGAIFGPESSGKTTLVYHVIAEAQRRGGICAFIDAEHAMDPTYAKRIGINIDNLLVSQPDTGGQALEIAELLIRSGVLDVVAVDSVAALTPKGEMGDSHVGLQARLMSQALRSSPGRSTAPTRSASSRTSYGKDRRHVRQSGDGLPGRPGLSSAPSRREADTRLPLIAEARQQARICAFIDAEHAMDPVYAKRIGVNIDDLLVSQPDTDGDRGLDPRLVPGAASSPATR